MAAEAQPIGRFPPVEAAVDAAVAAAVAAAATEQRCATRWRTFGCAVLAVVYSEELEGLCTPDEGL